MCNKHDKGLTVHALLERYQPNWRFSQENKCDQTKQHGRTDLHKHKAGVLQRASGQQVDCPLGGGNVQQPEHNPIQPAHDTPTCGVAWLPIPCALLNHLWHKTFQKSIHVLPLINCQQQTLLCRHQAMCIDNMAASRCCTLSGAPNSVRTRLLGY